MLINWINVTIYAEQWPKLFILLPQADRAITEIIERENVSTTTKTNSHDTTPVHSQYSLHSLQIPARTSKSQRELILSSKAKILAVYGLAYIQNKNYKSAAEKFLMVSIFLMSCSSLIPDRGFVLFGLVKRITF